MGRHIFKDIKTHFAISSLGILNPQTDNRLAKRVIQKSLKIMCENDIRNVFVKAAEANNTSAVNIILDFHTGSVKKDAMHLNIEKRDLPRVLTIKECQRALQISIENNNLPMTKSLINRFEEWNFCHPNPTELEGKTTQQFLSETLGLPITFGLQNLTFKEPERAKTPGEMERYLKGVLDSFLPRHVLSHIGPAPQIADVSTNTTKAKPQLKLIQGGKSPQKA